MTSRREEALGRLVAEEVYASLEAALHSASIRPAARTAPDPVPPRGAA